eukprot:13947912-Ditylum_brightwellii.AAC.1
MQSRAPSTTTAGAPATASRARESGKKRSRGKKCEGKWVFSTMTRVTEERMDRAGIIGKQLHSDSFATATSG